MAISKSRIAFTPLAASGNTTTLDVSAAGDAVLLLKHSNGTGTVTAPASFAVQVQPAGGSAWYTLVPLLGSTTAGSTEDLPAVAIPAPIASVRVAYTAPAGPTGYSLSGEIAAASY